MALTVALLPLDAATYERHEVHRPHRVWQEMNCAVDAWIEVLHSLGLDPVAATAFTLSTDFEGDQWTFHKYPSEDLYLAYGIEVHEMVPWRSLVDHVRLQLTLGRLMTVEVDSFYLPDTAGVSYRQSHVKSTIVINRLDPAARLLGYFHNAGYFELSGDDFDGAMRVGVGARQVGLVPYTELLRLDHMRSRTEPELLDVGRELLTKHLARRPTDNPVVRMHERMREEVVWLQAHDGQSFHDFAFVTLRQCGSAAETAATFCRWLAARDTDAVGPLELAATDLFALADSARRAQLKLARLARGRSGSLDDTLVQMGEQWAGAHRHLDRLHRG